MQTSFCFNVVTSKPTIISLDTAILPCPSGKKMYENIRKKNRKVYELFVIRYHNIHLPYNIKSKYGRLFHPFQIYQNYIISRVVARWQNIIANVSRA